MSEGHFGDFLRILRIRQSMTQIELSEELGVSVSTVFRIENGIKKPSYTQYQTIMQTLGEFSGDYIIVHMTHDEIIVYRLLSQLRSAIRDGRKDEAKSLYNNILSLKTKMEDEWYQFIHYAGVILSDNVKNEDAIAQLQKALALKRANFEDANISNYHLSYNEIVILGEIADRYSLTGNTDKAIELLTAVKNSMDKFYLDEREKSLTYPILLYNLSRLYAAKKNYDAVLMLCGTALKMALHYNNLKVLPYLIYNVSSAKFFKGNKEGCRRALAEAYYSATSMECYELAVVIKNDAKETFGVIYE